MSSEFARIALLREIFGALPPPSLGIGDDAAVLHDPRPLVATVDASVEGVHFRRDLLTLEEASARACEAAMSDVAAMGATLSGPGCGLLLAWTLPVSLSDGEVRSLAVGAARAATRAGTRVVGGNLAGGAQLTLTTTVLGRCDGPPLRRDGARPGDVLAVSGAIGLAAIGLRALLDARDPSRFASAIARWRAPTARLAQGEAVRRLATACIDVSDGLAQDAGHLASASGVALVLDLPALRALIPPEVAGGVEAVDDAITAGGEDYELLAAGPREAFDDAWTVVGEVREGAGVHRRDGARISPLPARGWDHFSLT